MLRSAKGAALVTALMLTMLALVISLTLLYTVTVGTKVSASQKRYRSALAAAQGGVEVLTLELMPRLLDASASADKVAGDFALIKLQLPQYACLQQKLTLPTGAWSACPPDRQPSDPASSPDVSFKLGGALPSDPGFSIAGKIMDSIPGNSDLGGIDYLEQGGSVSAKEEGIRPRHVPGLFNIAVQGVGGNAREKARLSLLYAY